MTPQRLRVILRASERDTTFSPAQLFSDRLTEATVRAALREACEIGVLYDCMPTNGLSRRYAAWPSFAYDDDPYCDCELWNHGFSCEHRPTPFGKQLKAWQPNFTTDRLLVRRGERAEYRTLDLTKYAAFADQIVLHLWSSRTLTTCTQRIAVLQLHRARFLWAKRHAAAFARLKLCHDSLINSAPSGHGDPR